MQNGLPGLMMNTQLNIKAFLERARRLFPTKTIRTYSGDLFHEQSYADLYRRCSQLAHGLETLGIRPGDRVATLAWNTYRHHELYFSIPGVGAVCHTLNLRLPAEQLIYIINHAADRVIFVDESLLPLLEEIGSQLTTVEQIVVMTDAGQLPETALQSVLHYEELLAAESTEYDWPDLDENSAAAMCYTSGTTGNPKGVLFSHRSIYLHTLLQGFRDTLALSERDRILLVAPMFHVMGWGHVYAGTMLGATIVYPGREMQPERLGRLIEQERITFTAGVPTLWIGLLQVLDEQEIDLSSLRMLQMAGFAVPRSLIEAYQGRYGIPIVQTWGMTETSPMASTSNLKQELTDLPLSQQHDYRASQGYPVVNMEMRIVDANGKEQPWDGQALGEIQVRGPWVIREYYQDERSAEAFMDGWLRTGDVATIRPDGYIGLVDRTKDLVKSGGEWISSVELESHLMAHEAVLEAAVIAIPHPKWQERPLACVVCRQGLEEDTLREALYAHLRQKFARWQLPDAIEFVPELPKTSVGKFDKKVLRKHYQGYSIQQ